MATSDLYSRIISLALGTYKCEINLQDRYLKHYKSIIILKLLKVLYYLQLKVNG